MKTIATLLMTSLLLAGTFNNVFAGEDARKESSARPRNELKIKREATAERTRDSRGATRTTTERRMEVQMPTRNQNREIKVRTTEVRQEANRTEQTNREIRPEANRNNRPSAEVRRTDNNRENQRRLAGRSAQRNLDFAQRPNVSYHDRHLQCAFCTGRGFTLHINGFRHLRCNHCEGRGYRIYREMYVGACPVCYDPLRDGQLDCTLEDLAWIETNRIALALELSDHQRNRIFDINYRYITHRYNGDYYPTTRRDREIRHILRLGQLVAFAILLNELHEGEVCYNCSNQHF